MAATIKQRIELDGGKELKRELQEFGAAGEKAFRALQKAAAETKGLQPGFFNSLKQAQVQLQGLSKQFNDVGKSVQNLGKTFATHLTLPLVGAGVGILKQAADFEKAGNSFAANAGVVGSAFEDATKKAQELGQASVFSSTEALQGMTELSKVGIDFQTIMGGAAKAMVDLAAANDTQLAPAATAIGDLINQFGLKVSQLPAIVNSVTGATIESKLSFEGYALALGQAGGAAGALGVNFEEFNAVLAATATSFSSGSDAGTSFKTFLTRLVPQSKQAAAMMEKLGIRFFDASGKMKSMSEIAQILQDKLSNLSQEDRNDAVSTIFGTDALRTALALMKLGGKGIDEMMAKLLATNAADIAATRVKGLAGELNQFNSAVENLSIAIGKSGFLDFVTQLVKQATDLTKSIGNLDPAVLRLGTEIGAVAAAIGPVLIALGLFGRGIGFVFGGIGQLLGAIVFLRNAFLTLTPLGRIILLIAVAIKGAGVVLDLIKNKQYDSATAANAHQKALTELDGAIRNVKAGVPGAEEALKRLAQSHLDAAKAAIADAEAQAKGAREAFEAAKLSQDQSALGPMEKRLGLDVDPALEQLIIREKNVAQAKRELEEIQAKIDGKVVSNIIDLRTNAAATESSLKGVGTAAADASTKVDGLTQTITVFRGGGPGGQLSKEVFNVVDGVAKRAEEGKQALDGLKGSVDATSGAVDGVSNEITNSISTIAPAAQEAASGFNSSLGSLDAGAAQAAAEAIVAPFSTLPGKISAILSGIRALLQGGFSGLQGIVSSLASQIESAINRILASLRAAAAAAQSLRAAAAGSGSSDGGGSHGGFARGGHLAHGPGTGTSDSILARLSVGEFVVRAKIVKALGADFFAALNAGIMPNIDAFRGLSKGFSMGGIADGLTRGMSVQRFAGGGLAKMQMAPVSAGNKRTPIVLQLPGGEQIDDLTIGDIALNRLQQFLVKESYASNGRRPRR
ncbi:phage tail tape measure protein [Mesorhizobium australicum]|uniref:Phage tail tape measure protein n=1 Tax=Mesorhizobium australicum TaxID=536018 RepID=A0ACC6T2V0_9HYPH